MPLRIVSWNVNGLRSCLDKGFLAWLDADKPDVVCLQEVRTPLAKLALLEQHFALRGYSCHWHPGERSGYAGTAVLARFAPRAVHYGLVDASDPHGRALTADFGTFKVLSLYAPNANPGTTKIPEKQMWLRNLAEHAANHAAGGVPLFVCGDLNVAHTHFDSQGVAWPPGFNGCTREEREGFAQVLDAGFCDPVRDAAGERVLSTWWGPSWRRTERNGIRLDYILINAKHRDKVTGSGVHSEVAGSDHCPVSLTADVSTKEQAIVAPSGQRSLL